jgi:large subunit ribosomal protein L32e
MDAKTKRRLLAVRLIKQKQRPAFVRVESWRYKRVHPSWRQARGIDSKTRRKTKNGVKSPEVGYKVPNAIRYLHPSGLKDILITHKEDLEGLSPKVHGVRIAKKLGAKKRIDLIEYARDKGFHILNIGISKEELSEIEKVQPEEKVKESSKKAQIEKIKTKGEKSPETEEEAPKEE